MKFSLAELVHVDRGHHLYNIKQKPGLNKRAEMTLLAARQGVFLVSD